MVMNRIAAVIVTFNRINYLKIALSKYDEMSLKPEYLVVVNNCSNDGTKEYLDNWAKELSGIKKIVVNLEQNIGGAGGFGTGLERAMNLDVDWIWLADDDAYPKKDTMEKLLAVYETIPDKEDVSCIFTSVIRKCENKYTTSHRRVLKKTSRGVIFDWVDESEYKKPYFEINQGTYCGMLAKKEMLSKTALTRRDFFIYYDDTEHTARLNKLGKMYCIPAAELIHDDGGEGGRLTWKEYYGTRNILILKKEQYGLYSTLMEIIKQYIKYAAFWKKDIPNSFKKMIKVGIRDGLKGRTGLHSIYKPGWKP